MRASYSAADMADMATDDGDRRVGVWGENPWLRWILARAREDENADGEPPTRARDDDARETM